MNIILALIIFSVLVIIHEFGHFLFAKKNGIRVTEFSVGMGPRLVSFEKGDTRYSWKLLPFGGSCMMLGEDEDVVSDKNDTFGCKSVWARISVVAAGPIFNFILAWVLAIIVIGFVGPDKPTVLSVTDGSVAQKAGLQEGDIITSYNGTKVSLGREISLEQYIHPISDQDIDITYERAGEEHQITITPEKLTKYALGVSYTSDGNPMEIKIIQGGALEAAGMKDGDVITQFNDQAIDSGKSFSEYVQEHPLTADEITIVYERDKKTAQVKVTPTKNEYYSTGFTYNVYRDKVNALGVVKYSFVEVKYVIGSTLKSLGMLVQGKVKKDDVAGPVGIVDLIGDAYNETKDEGALYVFLTLANLTILLSANLGVMNLLPIPALDGGRLLFLLIEVVRRKPIDREKEGMVHLIGMILLMILMVLILFNDVSRLFK